MSTRDQFITELQQESALTKKMLERVPFEHKDWKPHGKSMSIGRLATHIAEIPHWIADMLSADEYNFASQTMPPKVAGSLNELIEIFELNIKNAMAQLAQADDLQFKKQWTIKRGDQVLMSLAKETSIRSWGFNHIYHHRGQLTVFLRLLEIPVPGMYGPSADERR